MSFYFVQRKKWIPFFFVFEVVDYDGIPAEEFMPLLLKLQFVFVPSVSNSGVRGSNYTLEKTISEMGICYTFNSNLAIYNSPRYEEHLSDLPHNPTNPTT